MINTEHENSLKVNLWNQALAKGKDEFKTSLKDRDDIVGPSLQDAAFGQDAAAALAAYKLAKQVADDAEGHAWILHGTSFALREIWAPISPQKFSEIESERQEADDAWNAFMAAEYSTESATVRVALCRHRQKLLKKQTKDALWASCVGADSVS